MILCALLAVGAAHAQGRDPLPPHGFARVDADVYGVRGWVGGTFAVAPQEAIEVGAVVTLDHVEGQVGLTWEAGALYLMPLVGVEVAFEDGAIGIVPELYGVVEIPPLPIYLETWTRFAVRSPFGDAPDAWTHRSFLLWTLRRWIALGPEIDASGEVTDGLKNLPVGLRLNAGPPRWVTFGLFAGFETLGAARPDTLVPDIGLMGRLTAVVAW